VKVAVISGRRPRRDEPAPGLAGVVAGLGTRHELHLFVLAAEPPAPNGHSNGVHVHQVGIAKSVLGRRASRPHLVRALRATGPFDVVHVFLDGPASALALAAVRALGVPVVVSFAQPDALVAGPGNGHPPGGFFRSPRWRPVLSLVAAQIGARVTDATSPELVEQAYQTVIARHVDAAARRLEPPSPPASTSDRASSSSVPLAPVRRGEGGDDGTVMSAEQAYDLWAATYDQQDNNLLLHLDHELTFGDTTAADWRHKKILDFGCGTGRHWREVQSFGPELLVGVDISAEMLRKLDQSHPGAETYQIRDERLPMFVDGELDLVLSNLTIGYVSDLSRLLREWSRVLRSGGTVVITDMHPAALARGAKRNFTAGGHAVEIKNHPHHPRSIEDLARACGLAPVAFAERRVDDTTRAFFERAHALSVFDRMKETPLLYKLRLTKN
jgi:ubiquinone/menaquinone biosynthesis C-methylase UbiE